MADVLKIEGSEQLRKTMRRAGADMQQLKDAHRLVATTVATRGLAQAPVGPSGKLAKTVRPGATVKAAIVRAGKKNVPYAGPIHWGWPKRNIEAQPWLYEAAVHSEPVWVEIYTDAVNDIIDTIEGA